MISRRNILAWFGFAAVWTAAPTAIASDAPMVLPAPLGFDLANLPYQEPSAVFIQLLDGVIRFQDNATAEILC